MMPTVTVEVRWPVGYPIPAFNSLIRLVESIPDTCIVVGHRFEPETKHSYVQIRMDNAIVLHEAKDGE